MFESKYQYSDIPSQLSNYENEFVEDDMSGYKYSDEFDADNTLLQYMNMKS